MAQWAVEGRRAWCGDALEEEELKILCDRAQDVDEELNKERVCTVQHLGMCSANQQHSVNGSLVQKRLSVQHYPACALPLARHSCTLDAAWQSPEVVELLDPRNLNCLIPEILSVRRLIRPPRASDTLGSASSASCLEFPRSWDIASGLVDPCRSWQRRHGKSGAMLASEKPAALTAQGLTRV